MYTEQTDQFKQAYEKKHVALALTEKNWARNFKKKRLRN